MRHRFHAICPYFAMFPERFVQKHLVWSERGSQIFDCFSGRGTTVFESLLNGRPASGCDTNPVAVCVSRAKSDPADRIQVLRRLANLERDYCTSEDTLLDDPFFSRCFHRTTLRQLLYLRKRLQWRDRRDDCFIAALALGSLHGESHRSERYFSNRMPRTISTKPAYSVRWWAERGYEAPRRDVFSILLDMVNYRFTSDPPALRGTIREGDARRAAELFPEHRGAVSLLITSPPYLDTTNFQEDQWLRLWFLGGAPYPTSQGSGDDRHTSVEKYWEFLAEAWAGVAPLLAEGAHLVIRIGGKRLDRESIVDRLSGGLRRGLNRDAQLLGLQSSDISDRQTKAFRPSREKTGKEHDFHYVLA